MCVLYYAHKKHICAFFVCLQVIAMKELMKEVLPILRDVAYRQVQYPPEYAIQCRRAEAAIPPPIFFLEKKTGRGRSKRKLLTGQDRLDHSTKFSAAFAVTSQLPAPGPALSASLSATQAGVGSQSPGSPAHREILPGSGAGSEGRKI